MTPSPSEVGSALLTVVHTAPGAQHLLRKKAPQRQRAHTKSQPVRAWKLDSEGLCVPSKQDISCPSAVTKSNLLSVRCSCPSPLLKHIQPRTPPYERMERNTRVQSAMPPAPRFTHSSLTLHTHPCILNNGTNNSQTKFWASEHYKENYPGAFLRKHRSSVAWQHIPSAPDNIRAEKELNDFRRQAFKTVVASSLCPGTQKQWTEFSGHGVWRS